MQATPEQESWVNGRLAERDMLVRVLSARLDEAYRQLQATSSEATRQYWQGRYDGLVQAVVTVRNGGVEA